MIKSFAVLLCAIVFAAPAFAAKQYSYFRVGNPNDISTTTTPGTVLMGGGTDVDDDGASAARFRCCDGLPWVGDGGERMKGRPFLVISYPRYLITSILFRLKR